MVQATKRVQIVLRDGWDMLTPTVNVLWKCPTCGEPMGEPKGKNFFEDGDSHHCDIWDNQCGHVAHYESLQIELNDGNFTTWKEMLATGEKWGKLRESKRT